MLTARHSAFYDVVARTTKSQMMKKSGKGQRDEERARDRGKNESKLNTTYRIPIHSYGVDRWRCLQTIDLSVFYADADDANEWKVK